MSATKIDNLKIDVFCSVVDNLGDAGVCWRLARQLASEHAAQVRLWIDQPQVLAKMEPRFLPQHPQQSVAGIEILHWAFLDANYRSPNVVIEAFGCNLPACALAAMQRNPTVWINLEYLSAEPWVHTHHLLPSIHPATGLKKTFFFPGFTPQTGGLLRERFLGHEPLKKSAFLPHVPTTLSKPALANIFCFGYAHAPVNALLSAWQQQADELAVYLAHDVWPEITASHSVNAEKKITSVQNATCDQIRPLLLNLTRLPAVPQTEFDNLLTEFDILFVRGEDSFVRAQWAAKPFVWHIYPQAENAHHVKLNAFLDVYCEGLEATAAIALRDFWWAYNQYKNPTESQTKKQTSLQSTSLSISATWQAFFAQRKTLEQHAKQWRDKLFQQADLCSQLIQFIQHNKA